MSGRTEMQLGDWANSAFNLVFGTVLGVLLYSLIGLVTSGYWILALIIVIAFGAVFLFDLGLDWVINKFFPPGVEPSKIAPKRRKPILRLLSLPVGITFGVTLALVGLSDAVLSLF